MKKIFLFVVSVLIVQSFAEKEAKLNVGLAKFSSTVITNDELNAITAKFQDELFRINKFQLLEQGQMNSILKEKGFQESGCVKSMCLVDIGTALGVEQMIFGSVSKVGDVFSITAKIVDVKTGRIIKSAVIDAEVSVDKLIQKEIPELAERVVGKADASQATYEFDPSMELRPIAVLDIQGNGITKEESNGLTERLRSELFNTGKYEVMERELMDEILKEQSFQNSGACSEEGCIIEMGQLIGVEFMVGGSVTRIGNLYSVSSRIVDVGTGKIIRTATLDVNGSLEKVLKESMNDIARVLSGLKARKRTNTKAWTWMGISGVLAAIGGVFTWQEIKNYDLYQNSTSPSQVETLHNDIVTDRIVEGTFYGLSAIAAGIGTWNFLSETHKLEVKQLSVESESKKTVSGEKQKELEK